MNNLFNKELRTALEFYADPPRDVSVPHSYDEMDFGRKAYDVIDALKAYQAVDVLDKAGLTAIAQYHINGRGFAAWYDTTFGIVSEPIHYRPITNLDNYPALNKC